MNFDIEEVKPVDSLLASLSSLICVNPLGLAHL